MAKLGTHQIRDLAKSFIAANPGGIRYTTLIDFISAQSPETPRNTIHGSVWNLHSLFPNEVAKPSRGLFAPVHRMKRVPQRWASLNRWQRPEKKSKN